MKKIICSLFVLLTVFSIIAITPSVFADHSKVDINMAVGSSVPGCEEMNMCYMPYNAALDPGGEATWHNIDDMAHTVSSGTPAEGLDDVFDSSLVPAGGMFSYKFEEEDKKAERDLEILKKYQKKEAKDIKKIFIALFLLGALIYIVKLLMGFV